MDISQMPDHLGDGSSNAAPDMESQTNKSPNPPAEEKKKVYKSVFKHQSSSESDSSDCPAFSPDKKKNCEGILENLIKSEIHNIHKKFNIKKQKKEKKRRYFVTNLVNEGDLDHKKSDKARCVTSTSADKMGETKRVMTEGEGNDIGEMIQHSIGSAADETNTLTTEESERFASIAADLNILNTHGFVDTECDASATKLYTGPYGRIKSPFKKFSSFKSFTKGVKRSPRKWPTPSMKRPKLEGSSSSDCELSPEKETSPKSNERERSTSEGDSSDEFNDELKIIEDESDQELDHVLNSKSEKFSLSALNVRSIIHKIITNENVVEMVRRAVHEEFEENEAKDEPKMTRSKVKQTLQTEGNMPLWGISPRKNPADKSSFLDIDLPEEEEDDEDFNPDGLPADSDEDSESVVSSSCMSDLDSTMPSTPTTPRAVSPRAVSQMLNPPTPTTPDWESSQSLLSPMGPPLQNKVPKTTHKPCSLARKYQEAMEKDEAQEDEELIARRTRSKFPLNELSVFDLEANLVAPDISEDLYDTTCNDSDWQNFLYYLVKPDPVVVHSEDSVDPVTEDEDPEYNYLEEAEKESYDQEDFRDDRAVKVSKKELNLLMDELHDAYGESDPLDAECRKSIKAQTQKFLQTSKQKEESHFQQSLVLQVGEHERRQIDDQMRKHVQLLTQTFVMAQTGIEEHNVIASAAKMYLTEIARFADLSENMYHHTAYRTCNLQHAIDVINDPAWTAPNKEDTDKEVPQAIFKYDTLSLPSLTYRQMKTLWTSPCFMFPELLPHGGFFKMEEQKRDRARVKFLEAEDNLLVMGLEQFKDLTDPKQFIHQFMLPCKSKKQIQIRIKNLNAKAAKDNPVKFWKQYKQLPMIPQCAPVFDISEMKAVADRGMEADLLPAWCQVFRKDGGIGSPLVAKRVNRKRSSQSNSFSVINTGVTAIYFPPQSTSAPVTPCNQGSNSSSHRGSSGSSLGSPRSSDSQKAKPRALTGVHRKKLDMNVKEGTTSTSGMFVPLTMASQNNPITICMVDKLTGTMTSGSSTTTRTTSCSLGKPGTCIAPTIIFIKNTLPVATRASVQSSVASVSSVSSSASKSSTRVENVSSSVSSVTGKDTVQKDALQTALLSANILDGEASNNKNTASVALSVSPDTNVSGKTDDSSADPVVKVVGNPGETEASETRSVSMAACQTSQGSAGSADNSSIHSISNNWSLTVSTTPTHSVSDTDDHACCQMTPEQLTPTSVDSTSGATPKSAIEIMASYAPYFISPNEKDKNLQERLETTPKKSSSPYTRLAPKPTTPSAGTPQKSFSLEKKTSSPRRQQLQQKARSILPKGFVVSTFDNSPTKRAASNLIGKAKQQHTRPTKYGQLLDGFRKILPHPPESERVTSTMDIGPDVKSPTGDGQRSGMKIQRGGGEKRKLNDSMESMDVDSGTGEEVVGDTEDAGQDENRCGDTESDYTQSEEDGNETQDDSQEDLEDSVEDEPDEDETHIANLMQASTTVSSDFSRDEVSKVRMCKKDRDRDISLAMLAPDIMESDPQRDYRDTAFAQAYLHKVKKTLRDDMDTLERFLQLMYNFSKTTESPVKLYRDLRNLFENYPDLMTDFAGFLLPEQAIACDCYDTHQEFSTARTFLRKLEVYFYKTPHQFQKVMKTFSRWYRKPGRKAGDLREQVEPMLKGQRYLLEEFSKFFPDEPPPESAMDDFEEITLEDSGDDERYDSFEEIDLLNEDGEETLGTKRCPCQCHEQGDDNYRKKKKHCYRCCLTVIDGELVYRVNKSTIKRINVTFGPSVRAAEFMPVQTDDLDLLNDDRPEPEEDRKPGAAQAQEPDREANRSPGSADAIPASDWLLDNEAAEKENIEDYHLTRESRSPKKQDKNKKKHGVDQKPSSPQKLHKMPWPSASGKWVRLSDAIPSSVQLQHSPIQPVVSDPAVSTGCVSSPVAASLGFEAVTTQHMGTTNPQIVVLAMGHQGLDQTCFKQPAIVSEPYPNNMSGQENSFTGNGRSNQTSDILATAFSSAMMTEVSLDSMSMPFSLQAASPEKFPTSHAQSASNVVIQNFGMYAQPPVTSCFTGLVNPKPVQAVSISFPEISAPDSKESLNVSNNTSFLKVESTVTDTPSPPKEHADVIESLTQPITKVVDEPFQMARSPVFSPFSPYASEVQAINSMGSPLAPIGSPGPRCNRTSSVSKIRRITPIQVSENSQQSNSSFQSVMENSPIICDTMIHGNSFEIFGKEVEDGKDLTIGQQEVRSSDDVPKDEDVPSSRFHSQSQQDVRITDNVPKDEATDWIAETANQTSRSDSQSQQSNLLSSSQKSDCTLKSISSDSGDVPACSIKITEPVNFSEDANERFPAAPSTSAALLSDESLLHCLGKDAKFDDHIHNISNLTNILYALEGNTANSGSLKDSIKDTQKEQEINLTLSDISKLDNKNTAGQTEIIQDRPSINVCANQSGMSDSSSHASSAHSSEDEEDKTLTPEKCSLDIPQDAENWKRLEGGMFNVSRLSDSETSGKSTPANVSPEKEQTGTKEAESKVKTGPSGDSFDSHGGLQLHSVSEHSLTSKKEHSDWTYKPKYRDKQESSNDDVVKVKETGEKSSGFLPEPVSNSIENNADRSAIRSCDTKIPDSEISCRPSGDNVVESQMLASCDSDEKKSKRHKDKHKRKKVKKKEKRQKERSSKTVLDKMRSFSCTSLGEGQMSPNAYGPGTSSEQSHELEVGSRELERKIDIASPAKASSVEGDSEDQMSGVVSAADLCSNISSPCSSTEGHPEWSKDTDKTILEACKAHGIREKTFVKIAKQIGNVTPKQVRRRFGQLYKLILKPISKQAAKEPDSKGPSAT